MQDQASSRALMAVMPAALTCAPSAAASGPRQGRHAPAPHRAWLADQHAQRRTRGLPDQARRRVRHARAPLAGHALGLQGPWLRQGHPPKP